MTKAELIQAIADRAGLSKSQAKEALDAFVEAVTATVKAGQDVRIVGFGNFIAVDRPAGKARNPRTGATVDRPASKTVRFRPGEGLKGALQ